MSNYGFDLLNFDALKKALLKDPTNCDLLLRLAEILLEKGRPHDAYKVMIHTYRLDRKRKMVKDAILEIQENLFPLPISPPFDEKIVEIFRLMKIPFLTMVQYYNELGLKITRMLPDEYECDYRFPTEEQKVDLANQQFALLLEKSGLSETDQSVFCASFREGIINGAHHGNHWNPEKMLNIEYYVSTERVSVTITDEGVGFDWKSHIDPTGKIREDRPARLVGGMGILMMSKCLDEVSYNQKGTALTLAKNL